MPQAQLRARAAGGCAAHTVRGRRTHFLYLPSSRSTSGWLRGTENRSSARHSPPDACTSHVRTAALPPSAARRKEDGASAAQAVREPAAAAGHAPQARLSGPRLAHGPPRQSPAGGRAGGQRGAAHEAPPADAQHAARASWVRRTWKSLLPTMSPAPTSNVSGQSLSREDSRTWRVCVRACALMQAHAAPSLHAPSPSSTLLT